MDLPGLEHYIHIIHPWVCYLEGMKEKKGKSIDD